MKKTMKAALISVGLIALSAQAETRCERIGDHYAATGHWSRDCGPEPGKPFARELHKDCLQTARLIRARPGASWNSEHGWASDWQCAAIDNPSAN
jgi:hypothetical protein